MTYQTLTLHDVVRVQFEGSKYLEKTNSYATRVTAILKTGDDQSKVELVFHHQEELVIEGPQS